jgi:vacuolar-type H+-ATPase subunit I/STV1
MSEGRRSVESIGVRILRVVWPWLLTGGLGLGLWLIIRNYLMKQRGAEELSWHNGGLLNVLALLSGAVLTGLIAFHLHRRRSAAMGFSQVGLIGSRGVGTWLSDLPGVLRVCALGCIAVALARPETFRTSSVRTRTPKNPSTS